MMYSMIAWKSVFERRASAIIAQMFSTITGKILLVTWTLTLLMVIGLPLLGWFAGDLLGYLVVALMVSFMLADIAIVLSYRAKGITRNVSRTIWITLAITDLVFTLCLVNSLIGYPDAADRGIGIGITLWFPMSIASFPISIGIVYFIGGLTLKGFPDILGTYLPVAIGASENIPIFLMWLILASGGYLQWFKLFPFLIHRLSCDTKR